MKIPRVILEAESYRKEVIEEITGETLDTVEIYTGNDEESEGGSAESLALLQSFDSLKDRTNYALMQLYEQKGYDAFKQVCTQMKANNWFDGKEYGLFKGEACEAYLTVTIKEFIKKYNLNWRVYTSLIIRKADDDREGACTELDVVLVTEEMITVFEAKTYNGKRNLTEMCTIDAPKGAANIFQQNSGHCKSLIRLIQDLNINGNRGMKSALFWYANGTLTDNREVKYKSIMPAITEDTLLVYLTALTKLPTKYWRHDIFTKFDELTTHFTREDHAKFVGYKQ